MSISIRPTPEHPFGTSTQFSQSSASTSGAFRRLPNDEFNADKCARVFQRFQNDGLKFNIIPLPSSGDMYTSGHYSMGPCIENRGLIFFEHGNSENPPGIWTRGKLNEVFKGRANSNNGWIPYYGGDIGDKEITSESEKRFYFCIDRHDRDDVKVISRENGNLVCVINPFEGLSDEELLPPYQANDPRFLANFPGYNGDNNLLPFNCEAGKEVESAHSFGPREIITVTTSGVIGKWKIEDNNTVNPIGIPFKVFEAYAGPHHTAVLSSWISGNSLFIKVYKCDEWSFYESEKNASWSLLQFDIRTNTIISELPLTEFSYIAVNSSSLFVSSFRNIFLQLCQLDAYLIDRETLALNPTWSYTTTNTIRPFKHIDLVANNQWVVFTAEDVSKILVLNAESGEIFWEIPTQEGHTSVYLRDDIIIFRDKNLMPHKSGYSLAHVPSQQLVSEDIPAKLWKHSGHSHRVLDEVRKEFDFKIDLAKGKIYGLVNDGSLDGMLEISPLNVTTSDSTVKKIKNSQPLNVPVVPASSLAPANNTNNPPNLTHYPNRVNTPSGISRLFQSIRYIFRRFVDWISRLWNTRKN
jgi:hypothetical protein